MIVAIISLLDLLNAKGFGGIFSVNEKIKQKSDQYWIGHRRASAINVIAIYDSWGPDSGNLHFDLLKI